MKMKNQNKFRFVFTIALLIVVALNTNTLAQVSPYPVKNYSACPIKINYECYCPGVNPPTNVCGFGSGISIAVGGTYWITCSCSISGCAGGDLIISLAEVDGIPISNPGCAVSGSYPNDTFSASTCSQPPVFPNPGTMTWNVGWTIVN